ncbi:DNA glycosylase [Schizopora paradoxa]|uniref:DNA-(apurinic or apyrimidinic site) lyase n=1 Tax=Schizopora paradoxa TaxID=27342 RepID=A0A0H2S9H1_9AGAM|nr:DNA glycosylase [Schizopora paradoxa]
MSLFSSAGFRSLPLPIGQLSLAAVLNCGQSFRWSCHPLACADSKSQASPNDTSNEYRLCLQDRVICVAQNNKELLYRAIFPQTPICEGSSAQALRDGETLSFIRDYFQLDQDLLKLYEVWGENDATFRNLKDRFSGLRMLRQDPWETLVSFICSANNNISRITKMVQNLGIHFSEPLALPSSQTNNQKYHPFPPPSALAPTSVADKLRELGFGYRAKFIQKTAEMLMEEHGSDAEIFKWLNSLRSRPTDEARAELLKLMGVGRKVADCILLMSLDKPEVVPVDTHVFQIAVKYYGFKGGSGSKLTMTPKLYDDITAKLVSIWGSYSGWAQTVLFTADLKAFANYNLPVAPSADQDTPVKRTISMLPTPSPSPSPKKRKRTSATASSALEVTSITTQESELLEDYGIQRRLRSRKVTSSVITSSNLSLSSGSPT